MPSDTSCWIDGSLGAAGAVPGGELFVCFARPPVRCCVLLGFFFFFFMNVKKISTLSLLNYPAILTLGSFATAARIDSISCAA